MDQHELIRYSLGALERLAVPHMIVGSFAGYAYGEPRFTQDIDIVLDLPLFAIDLFCREFPAPEFYVSADAVRDAARDRFQFNVLHPSSGNKIDCIFPKSDEWGSTQLGRRRRVQLFPGVEAFIASPEDVILGKLWYYADGGSEKHLRDIAGILRISGDQVDRGDVSAWAAKLGYTEIWNAILKKVDGG